MKLVVHGLIICKDCNVWETYRYLDDLDWRILKREYRPDVYYDVIGRCPKCEHNLAMSDFDEFPGDKQ
jgi:hypothetical protein